MADISNGKPSSTRMERAAHTRGILVGQIYECGTWWVRPGDDRAPRRLYATLKGRGWDARLSVDIAEDFDAEAAVERIHVEPLVMPGEENLDLWVDDACKVLSMTRKGDDLKLVSMVPGPWEAIFGLQARAWPPHIIRRRARLSRPFLRAA